MLKIHRFDLLIAIYIFCVAVTELMGAKTFPVANIGGFQLNASVAIFVVPLMFTITDAVIEVYDKDRARSLISSGLITIALLLGFSLLATVLPPSARFANTEPAYDRIFSTSARIAAASLTAFAIAAFLDVVIFARLRAKLHRHALWLRNNVSNFISQFFDTVIFITLAFYAPAHSISQNFSFLLGLAIPFWLLKCAMSVIETPLVYAAVNWLRKDKNKAIS